MMLFGSLFAALPHLVADLVVVGVSVAYVRRVEPWAALLLAAWAALDLFLLCAGAVSNVAMMASMSYLDLRIAGVLWTAASLVRPLSYVVQTGLLVAAVVLLVRRALALGGDRLSAGS